MRRLRVPFTALLLLFLLVDGLVLSRLWISGWPKRISLTGERDVARIQVIPISFTSTDWLILALLIGAHIVLLFLVWKTWHRISAHGQSQGQTIPGTETGTETAKGIQGTETSIP